MTEFEILSFIQNRHGEATEIDFTAKAMDSKDSDFLSDRRRLECLVDLGYVEKSKDKPFQLQLTGTGLFRLDSLKLEEKEKRKQRRFEIFLALLSALAGAVLSQPLWSWLS